MYSHLLSKWSAEQDRSGDERLIGKMRALSAPGLVVFTLTTTFAFIDWIMSLEPHWFSTIYGAMFMVGEMVESFAFVIALMIILSRKSPLKEYVTPQHLHDLGNMMFAFMVLWAYLSFSQFLIIWAGNLPEEIPWYVSRLRGGWGWVALILYALRLGHRASLLRAAYPHSLDGFCNPARRGRPMARGVFLATEIAALAAAQGPAPPRGAAGDGGVLAEGEYGRTSAT